MALMSSSSPTRFSSAARRCSMSLIDRLSRIGLYATLTIVIVLARGNTMTDGPWAGEVAFGPGAVTGVGLGVAQASADAGRRLALSYRNEGDKARTAEWFAAKGYEQPLFCKLDVTDRARFAEVADEVVAHFGEVHVLVNNAGVSVFGPTDEASYDDYDWIMGVNFGGVVNGLVSFLPRIKASTGRRHVVN